MSVEIGSYLRLERESIGISLDQLQEKTKIQKSFLIAIEKGEFNKLPSPFYVRSYLRSYANCVKVEPHHILRQYRKEEQAERGLTGEHKVIDERDITLARTKNLLTQKTCRIPVISKLYNTRSQINSTTVGINPEGVLKAPINRTIANTALTIAQLNHEPNSELVRKELASREIVRRGMGYQRSGDSMSRLSASISPIENETLVANDNLCLSIPPRKLRGTQTLIQSAGVNLVHEGETNTNLVKISSATLPSRVVKSRRGMKKKFPFRFKGKTVGISLIVFIVVFMSLVGVFVSSFWSKKVSTASKPISKTEKLQPIRTGNLQLTNQDIKANHYRLSDTDSANILFTSVGESSRIQIRTDLKSDGKYIDDKILTKGIQYSFKYNFDQTSDLYINLEKPQTTQVMVNGQTLKSNSTIHIFKQSNSPKG